MSILDDAIREHLELKRAHGADDSELKKLEDEAFGPPQRPDEIDPFAEAPTEFLASPTETPAAEPGIGDEAARGGRRPDIADLQEAPPAPPAGEDSPGAGAEAPQQEELVPAPDAPPPSPADAADVPLPPPADELPAPSFQAADEEPADEALAASGVPTVPAADEPAAEAGIADDAGPTTEERHAIADQPTQMFDVQAHVESEAADAPPAEAASPTDEQLIDAAQGEPQASPPAPEEDAPDADAVAAPDPFAAPEADAVPDQEQLDTRGPDAEVAGHPPAEAEPTEEESAEFDFFNEQRLSDELDQALEAPLPPTDEHIAMPQYGDAPPPAQGGIFDIETEDRYEEDPSEEVLRRHDTPAPPTEEAPRGGFDPPSEEFDPPSEEAPRAAAEPDSEEADAYDPDTGHEDVLEDTPNFLEDAPEDDDLWFEQKPPKDFDL